MADDTDMVDAPNANGSQDEIAADTQKPFLQRLKVLNGESNSAASFEFSNEDHTLGNALRHIIMKNPDVEFCGYSIPHPSNPKMHLRIQTYDDVSVYDVLEKGLNDLIDACDVVTEKFTEAKETFPKQSSSA